MIDVYVSQEKQKIWINKIWTILEWNIAFSEENKDLIYHWISKDKVFYVGYLRGGFEYFPGWFTQEWDQDRSRWALSNGTIRFSIDQNKIFRFCLAPLWSRKSYFDLWKIWLYHSIELIAFYLAPLWSWSWANRPGFHIKFWVFFSFFQAVFRFFSTDGGDFAKPTSAFGSVEAVEFYLVLPLVQLELTPERIALRNTRIPRNISYVYTETFYEYNQFFFVRIDLIVFYYHNIESRNLYSIMWTRRI
jgi:hypothetical protein